MNQSKISFKPLEEKDIDLLAVWFKQPHVAQWWPAESMLERVLLRDKYLKKLQSNWQAVFIVYLGDRPIGYIQCYHACKEANGWWSNEPAGTWGIDQFIGEPGCIGKGYGTQMIKNFVTMLFNKPEIKRIITDPDPGNSRAIRCYEKAGFKKIGLSSTPDGVVELMEITR